VVVHDVRIVGAAVFEAKDEAPARGQFQGKRFLAVALQGVPGFRTRRLRDTFAVELLTHSGVQTTERYYAPRDRSRRDHPTPGPGGQIRFERTSPRFKGIYGLPTMVC